ncbi:carboxypeptidase-like regulatory domain-containing protein [Virgisporangium aliadipatigenens]|nr:carboxypeptidase-like regulatory domain-containing protein [Virgisporangium aliadipatigenens]
MRSLMLLLVAVGVLTLGGCGAGGGSGPGDPEAPVSDASASRPAGPAGRGSVSGRVLGADGAPVAGALVQPSGVGDAPPVPELAVTTGVDGTYRWSLAPGTYQFTVTPAGGAPTEAGPVTVTAGDTVTLDVRLR